jgi:hypothetical protein
VYCVVQVELQIYIISEQEHRPLDVMCCTWNVGNAQPSMGLDEWLSGVPEQEHDLVAIGELRGISASMLDCSLLSFH